MAVHVIFPFVCIWERTGKLKREGGEGAEKDSMHTSRQRKKMPQKMTATCHTRPQASLHKYKAAGINERQQEHTEPGAKILMNIVARTAGWRSSLSNGAHWRKPNKRRGPGAETSLQQPQHQSQSKLTLSNVLFQLLLGGERLINCSSSDVKSSCSV